MYAGTREVKSCHMGDCAPDACNLNSANCKVLYSLRSCCCCSSVSAKGGDTPDICVPSQMRAKCQHFTNISPTDSDRLTD